jgi:hypothetical protein
LPDHQRVNIDLLTVRQVFERTSVTTDFSTMLDALHSGPKQRGTERKQFSFSDRTTGDVYRCVLLAIKEDPATFSVPYDEMLRRTKQVCIGESPVGSSVSQCLAQMAELAKQVQQAPVLEWDEDVLDIVEPLFFLRCSPRLGLIARKK